MNPRFACAAEAETERSDEDSTVDVSSGVARVHVLLYRIASRRDPSEFILVCVDASGHAVYLARPTLTARALDAAMKAMRGEERNVSEEVSLSEEGERCGVV